MRRAHLFLLLFFLTGCVQAPATPQIMVVTSPPEVRLITTTPGPPVVIVVTATFAPATASPEPEATPTAVCRKSRSVTADDIGETVDVCGVILEEGWTACEACPNGGFSYLVLSGGLRIISYDWDFFSSTGFSYEGTCVRVTDSTESVGGRPGFVFSKADGYEGVCTTGADGRLVCREGDYFEFVDQMMCY